MVTNEERRYVAARTRGQFDVCECAGHTYINGTLFGMQVCARDETALRDGMRHLADLIDPTCEMVDVETEQGGYRGTGLCSECGDLLTPTMRFCPRCGARVVDHRDE